jgi:hypothetical protein
MQYTNKCNKNLFYDLGTDGDLLVAQPLKFLLGSYETSGSAMCFAL